MDILKNWQQIEEEFDEKFIIKYPESVHEIDGSWSKIIDKSVSATLDMKEIKSFFKQKFLEYERR